LTSKRNNARKYYVGEWREKRNNHSSYNNKVTFGRYRKIEISKYLNIKNQKIKKKNEDQDPKII